MFRALARQQSTNEAAPGVSLATHPFGQTSIDDKIKNGDMPSGKRDLLDSWQDYECGTAEKNQITARLHDAWRLLDSMLIHTPHMRPTAADVCTRMTNEGLADPKSLIRQQVWAHGDDMFCGPGVGMNAPRKLLQPRYYDAFQYQVDW